MLASLQVILGQFLHEEARGGGFPPSACRRAPDELLTMPRAAARRPGNRDHECHWHSESGWH